MRWKLANMYKSNRYFLEGDAAKHEGALVLKEVVRRRYCVDCLH
jgi:hypothetical protein